MAHLSAFYRKRNTSLPESAVNHHRHLVHCIFQLYTSHTFAPRMKADVAFA